MTSSWQKLRLEVLQRDSYQCQNCYKSSHTLDVHHIIPRHRKGLDILNNLVALCIKCHKLLELVPLSSLYKNANSVPAASVITTLVKPSSNSAALRTVVPMSMIKQWNLKQGDKLEWSWEPRKNNNEMVMVIRKVRRRQQQSDILKALQKHLQKLDKLERYRNELDVLAD